ncbi:MAG: AAA family ATPase [Flavobacteriales bacterium]|nr:AAA family ATPase [Flavobacteriales bacterium]
MSEPLKNMEELAKDVNSYSSPTHSEKLLKLLKTEELIRETKKSNIRFAPPLITWEELPVIFPNTISVIQGQHGVHKSRLAEIICVSLLSGGSSVGFRGNKNSPIDVIYLDTERNWKDQFAAAIQSIQKLCGIKTTEDIPNLRYSSLLDFKRSERFEALHEFLEYIRHSSKNHIVVILDVLSDCVSDFNNAEDSLQLIDMMNSTVNNHNATFVAVIHENPNSQKARGHLGTELSNKASTVMQISRADNSSGESDIIKISYLKCRRSQRHPDLFVKYCQEQHTLIPASEDEIVQTRQERQLKAPIEGVKEAVRVLMNKKKDIKKTDLISILAESFICSENTIRERLDHLIEDQTPIVAKEDQSTKRLDDYKIGRTVWLKLSPVTKS